MNSKRDLEKDLLQQITHLTRLIERSTNSSSTRHVVHTLSSPNQNVLKSCSSFITKDNTGGDNAAKSQMKSSTSVLQECNNDILTSTDLKVLNNIGFQKLIVNKMCKVGMIKNDKDGASESNQSSVLNSVNSSKHNADGKIDVMGKSLPSNSNKIPSVESKLSNKNMHDLKKLTQIKTEGAESVTIKDYKTAQSYHSANNSPVKKSIYVNRKVLFENLKLENNQQSHKNCVHLNPAKLQLKSSKNENKEIGTPCMRKTTLKCAENSTKLCDYGSDKVFVPVRKFVHINPKFDTNAVIKQKVESFDPKLGTSTVSSMQNNKSYNSTLSSKICADPVPKIHVNKNFISKNPVLNDFSMSGNSKTSRNFEAQNSKNLKLVKKNQNNSSTSELNTKNIPTPDRLENTKLQNGTEVASSVLPCNTNSYLRLNKYSTTNVNKSLMNSRPTAYYNSALKFRSQLKEQSNETIINNQAQNSKMKYSAIQRNTPSFPVCKFGNKNKNIIINKNNVLNKYKKLNKLQVINSSTSSSNITNFVPKNFKLVNKIKQMQPKSQPVLKRSNSNIKPEKLVRLSRTKLVRAKSHLLPSTSKNNVKTADTKSKNQNLLSMKRNKRIWIAPSKNIETNLQKKKTKTATTHPSPYKYNSISESNKLKYVKVNSSLKTCRKIINSPKNEKKLGNISLNLSKGKYGVQKQRTSIRRLSQTNLVSVSRTKLVRKSKHDIRPSRNVYRCNHLSNSRPLSLNNKVIKASATLRTARSVKSKYKLIRNSNLNRATSSLNSISRTKVVNGISRNSSRRWKRSVTIGGIKYHTTEMKLCRKFPVKEGKIFASRVFKNKGESYRVSRRGRCLKRINCPDIRYRLPVNSINRSNSCYRYNAIQRLDFAHNKVALAKQKSIALLTRKLRKSNEPCLIFNRLGRCSGHERGVCNRLHDKKRVAICRKFLRGTCEKKECLLSHDVGPSKMPTCRHYLACVCTRYDCPYLHVKVNSSAPICVQFLQGYCPNAEKCKKRHIAMCPEYEEKGVCSKGKSCPYPHPKLIKNHPKDFSAGTVSMEKFVSVKNAKTEVDESKSEEVSDNDLKTSRYYCTQPFVIDNEVTASKRTNDESLEDSLVASDWFKKRPKIGDLPGFIPLNADNSQS